MTLPIIVFEFLFRLSVINWSEIHLNRLNQIKEINFMSMK